MTLWILLGDSQWIDKSVQCGPPVCLQKRSKHVVKVLFTTSVFFPSLLLWQVVENNYVA